MCIVFTESGSDKQREAEKGWMDGGMIDDSRKPRAEMKSDKGKQECVENGFLGEHDWPSAITGVTNGIPKLLSV